MEMICFSDRHLKDGDSTTPISTDTKPPKKGDPKNDKDSQNRHTRNFRHIHPASLSQAGPYPIQVRQNVIILMEMRLPAPHPEKIITVRMAFTPEIPAHTPSWMRLETTSPIPQARG